MNLLEAIQTMELIPNHSEGIKEHLNHGNHVLLCDEEHGNIVLKHDYFIKDGVLFGGLLSEVTSDPIVITPKSAVVFNDDFYHELWKKYISKRDHVLVDTLGHMKKAQIYIAQYDVASITKQLNPGEVIFFNDPSNPFDGLDNSHVNVYIIDNDDAKICGLPAVKEAVMNLHGLKITEDPKDADFSILILPSATKVPHKKVFEWLDSKNKAIPVVKETLQKNCKGYSKEHPILLYWPTNVLLTGLFNANDAIYKATSELLDAVKDYLNA